MSRDLVQKQEFRELQARIQGYINELHKDPTYPEKMRQFFAIVIISAKEFVAASKTFMSAPDNPTYKASFADVTLDLNVEIERNFKELFPSEEQQILLVNLLSSLTFVPKKHLEKALQLEQFKEPLHHLLIGERKRTIKHKGGGVSEAAAVLHLCLKLLFLRVH